MDLSLFSGTIYITSTRCLAILSVFKCCSALCSVNIYLLLHGLSNMILSSAYFFNYSLLRNIAFEVSQ